MSRRWNDVAVLLPVVLSAVAAPARACGPFFPNTILDDAADELLRSPAASFVREVERIPVAATGLRARNAGWDAPDQTCSADTNELRAVFLSDGVMTPAERHGLDAFAHARRVIAAELDRTRVAAPDAFEAPLFPATRNGSLVLPPLRFPPEVPAEFVEYLKGAAAWHAGDANTARQEWQRLLERPEAERRHRSTWAAYMLGRSCLPSAPEDAIARFRQVRALAERGLEDSLGLAAASLGWEAFAEFTLRRIDRAVELYLAQHATGDRSAAPSLRVIAERIAAAEGPSLEQAALNERVRAVVTAYVLGSSAPGFWPEPPGARTVTRWLRTVQAAGVRDLAGADRLAWAAYRAGCTEQAAEWVARAPAASAITWWIRAKLALRAGKTAEAKSALAQALNRLATPGATDSGGMGNAAAVELAALHTADREYSAALDLFVRYGSWWDAAYIAERVLTSDELLDAVRDRHPQTAVPANDDVLSEDEHHFYFVTGYVPADDSVARLRYLLARRLAREGKPGEAREFYPARWQSRLDAYTRHIEAAARNDATPVQRGRSLWAAARLARYQGMELFGTELDPDWCVVDGVYRPSNFADLRRAASGMQIAPPSPDELARVTRNAARHPTERFHYRAIAADQAWRAAALMPDHSTETAEMLFWGGTWLKNHDPHAADKFYKALVNRCRRTPLGAEANRLRWFPKAEGRPRP